MSDVIDLSKPTGYFEVAVFHYEGGAYSVDTDRGLGRLTVWETDSRDKALGIAEYIESERRYYVGEGGEFITNEGTPFDGSIVHWDCDCTRADLATAAPKGQDPEDSP